MWFLIIFAVILCFAIVYIPLRANPSNWRTYMWMEVVAGIALELVMIFIIIVKRKVFWDKKIKPAKKVFEIIATIIFLCLIGILPALAAFDLRDGVRSYRGSCEAYRHRLRHSTSYYLTFNFGDFDSGYHSKSLRISNEEFRYVTGLEKINNVPNYKRYSCVENVEVKYLGNIGYVLEVERVD